MSTRAAIDSNILIYAALEPGSEKGVRSAQAIHLTSTNGVLATQALLEFVAVVRRRQPSLTEQAFIQADAWASIFDVAHTTTEVMRSARYLVERHKFQVWDAVIWCAARQAGATLFLSEDLQNGFAFDGLKAVNPFPLSEGELDVLLR